MAIDATDWSVTGVDVRYIGDAHGGGSPTYATVIEFHRWLQDIADDAVFVGDDQIDITLATPSDRSTDNIITLINGYNIDDTSAEHLYDGSIIQLGGATIYDGIVNFGNTSKINVMQNGALIVNDFWNSFSPAGFNNDAGQGISHRFMIKTRTASADIDGRRLLGMSRQINKTWSEFPINGTSRGNNVLALSETDDLNNETAAGTIATWTDIVNDNEGYSSIDADGNATPEFYYSDWELGARSKNNFYERMKYDARDGTAATLYGIDGDIFRGITHEVNVDTPTGTLVEPEQVTWTGGVGQLLAADSTTAATKIWIQLLSGVAPTDGQVITGNGGGTVTVNVTVTSRPVSVPFVGASTGSAIIGAYGFGIGADDLAATDKVTDLTATLRTPPNNVTFTVNGLVSGEDRVLVGPETGGALDVAQFTLATLLDADNETAVVINTAVPTDTPSSGTIRVQDDAGLYRRLEYSSYTGSTFTISSTDGNEDFLANEAAISNNVFISYIDELALGTLITAGAFTATVEYVIESVGTTDFTLIGAASNTVGLTFTASGAGTGTGTARVKAAISTFTSVYLADRSLFIRARDGADSPIKTFETTGTLTNAGGSTTVIRTSDE